MGAAPIIGRAAGAGGRRLTAALATRTAWEDGVVMADLQVVAVLTARTGSEQAVGEALNALVEPTRAEPGCTSYHLFVSEADPATFITVETWRSQDDLDAHFQTPHVQQALAAAGDHLAAAPAIHPLSKVSAD
jgi:quinol monooxygenase YgiN